jgi:hypothetical protein
MHIWPISKRIGKGDLVAGDEVLGLIEGVGRDHHRHHADFVAVFLLRALQIVGEGGAVWAGGLDHGEQDGLAAIIGEIVPDTLAVH